MTPAELAAELGIAPKRLRTWLRANRPRSPYEKHQRWDLDVADVDAARAHFRIGTLSRDTGSGSRLPLESHDDATFEDQVTELTTAVLHDRAQVRTLPCPVPALPGVYGWWFRTLPARINVENCLVRDGSTLLYTGISPRRPTVNGQLPSRQTLRSRITYHYAGNAEGSTLRKTLGILLKDTLGIELRRVGSGKRMTFGAGEPRLSEWMAENARVSWIVDAEPWLVEERFIANLDVPLNLDGNRHNAFHSELTEARAAAVARARQLEVIENPGVGGRRSAR